MATEIPTTYVEFAEKMAALAAEYGLSRMHVSFTPGVFDSWNQEIQMSWETGRHEDSVKQFQLSSTIRVYHTGRK